MSDWTCAGCGIEIIDGLKTCACDTMVMVEDGGLGRSEWMHYPVAQTDLELAILECKTFEDFLTVQKTVAALRAATHSPSGPPSPPDLAENIMSLDAAVHRLIDAENDEMQVERMETALTLIASHAGQTLISVEHGQPYSIGANAAFEQLADIARQALQGGRS